MNLKTCTKCGVAQDISQYSLVHPAKKDGKLRPDCKSCVRARTAIYCLKDPDAQARRMQKVKAAATSRNKKFLDDYLHIHHCVDCGESDPIVLDFDHVSGVKACDVSRLICSGAREWRVLEEIAKCEVRCANCHRRKTAERAGWKRGKVAA